MRWMCLSGDGSGVRNGIADWMEEGDLRLATYLCVLVGRIL